MAILYPDWNRKCVIPSFNLLQNPGECLQRAYTNILRFLYKSLCLVYPGYSVSPGHGFDTWVFRYSLYGEIFSVLRYRNVHCQARIEYEAILLDHPLCSYFFKSNKSHAWYFLVHEVRIYLPFQNLFPNPAPVDPGLPC